MNNPYFDEFHSQHAPVWTAERFTSRHEFVLKYSWAVPSPEVLEWMAANTPRVVEIGAGTGYWAYLLDQLGVDVIAYDKEPYDNGWAEGKWFHIHEGGPEMAAEHPDRALFISWPPYDKPMAADALRAYQGDTLVYIGEGEGGCTADDAFHHMLCDSHYDWREKETFEHPSEWTLIEQFDIPQWDGMHDSVHVYRRNNRG